MERLFGRSRSPVERQPDEKRQPKLGSFRGPCTTAERASTNYPDAGA
jgi:hypothetical protein